MGIQTSPEHPAPVRQIASAIAGWIDRLGAVWVEGQIAQMNRRQGMNTVFMTLRDTVADISIQVTCSRTVFDSLNPPVVEGASVVVFAKPSYYPNRGTLSLYATDIRMVGLGELLARLERRRQLLAAEGLFARELKRALPFLPNKVGLVTAHSSAAERDVLENARRRWPAVRFDVRYASMQGPNAAREVIEAITALDRDREVDVIIVARGGGSVEDLLPFSDEGLIRAVHKVRTTVVSAIGHEPDTPLLDLVADVRASTPTDAAKMVVPDVAEETDRINHLRDRGRHIMAAWVAQQQHHLDAIRARPSLANPRSGLDDRSREVTELCARTRRCLRHQLDRAHNDLEHQLARVRSLSPLATLERGYAVVQDDDGHVVTSTGQVSSGQELHVRVRDGRLHVTVGGASADVTAAAHRAAAATDAPTAAAEPASGPGATESTAGPAAEPASEPVPEESNR